MCGRLPWRSWPFLPALRRENPESDVQLCHGHGHSVVRKILQEQRLHAPYGCTRQLLQVTNPKAQFRRRTEMFETIEGHAHQVVWFVRVREGWGTRSSLRWCGNSRLRTSSLAQLAQD